MLGYLSEWLPENARKRSLLSRRMSYCGICPCGVWGGVQLAIDTTVASRFSAAGMPLRDEAALPCLGRAGRRDWITRKMTMPR